jgi:hypothetical protein
MGRGLQRPAKGDTPAVDVPSLVCLRNNTSDLGSKLLTPLAGNG